jgi:WD40 repeat protein
MYTPHVNGSGSCGASLHAHSSTLPCGLHVALAIITTFGLAVSICALVTYAPPGVGYCGGAASLLALTTWVVSSVKCSLPSVPTLRDVQVADGANAPVRTSTAPHASLVAPLPVPSTLTQPAFPLPDEVVNYMFSHLSGPNLVSVSRVCKLWHRLAAKDSLWQNICLRERLTLSGESFSHIDFHRDAYRRYKNLRHYILTIPPQVSTRTFVEKNCQIHSFLKTGNLFCSASLGHPSSRARLEVWDIALNELLNVRSSTKYINEVEIKLFGNKVYFICGEQKLYNRNPHDPATIEVHVFDTEHFAWKPKVLFDQVGYGEHDQPPMPLALEPKRAFTGQKDGAIGIWDLQYSDTLGGVLAYGGKDPKWDAACETEWQASYDHNELFTCYWGFESTLFNPTCPMPQGYFERYIMEPWRCYQHLYDNRLWLKGHTEGITALHISGPFLFSAAQDGTIKQWDLSTLHCVQTIATDLEPYPKIDRLQVVGQHIFGWRCGKIYQWDLVTGKYLWNLDEAQKSIDDFCIEGNLRFCTGTKHGIDGQIIEIYDLSNQERIKTLTIQPRSHLPHGYNQLQVVNNSIYALGENRLVQWDFSPPH